VSVPNTGGTYVYHPLGPFTPLFELWKSAVSGQPPSAASVPPELLKQYRLHLAARLRDPKRAKGAALPDLFEEDRRPLVQQFRAFLPLFLARIGAPPERAQGPVSFPKFDIFDARGTEGKQMDAIFVSSRVLDIVELFARTMSLCARLNGLALPILIGAEDPPPPFVALAWLPLMDIGVPGLSLSDLGGVRNSQLREKVFEHFGALPEESRRASGRWKLTHYLAQAMLLAMERLLRADGCEGEGFLDVPKLLPQPTTDMTLDAQYLANLVLAFIVLHEHAHLLHQHNSFEPLQEDPQMKKIVDGMMRHAQEHGDGGVDLRGSTQQFEQDADCFPFEATPEEYQPPLLEAATLWFTALGSADRGGLDWLARSSESKGRAYPQYAMRVWFLNGRFSKGARQGEVAQAITRTAEAVERQPSMAMMGTGAWLPVFRELWAIAQDEAELPSSWTGQLKGWWSRP
jgi:hypothetical protein